MPLVETLIGRPLASDEDEQQRIGALAGVPVFGLDALGSAAYGPEAALTILIPAAAAGLAYVLPITALIIVLLSIVYLSYRQTIAAYPQGGGSYTVARQNLGPRIGLFAAAALMTDYVLNVAVGISAGVGALVSAVTRLQPYTLPLCLGILLLITIVNLRGVRETGVIFMMPTYLFIGCMLGAIAWGVFQTVTSHGHPHPVVAPPHIKTAAGAVGIWLLLKAFASGCTAMTGVEAVSNGVQSFREPVIPTARRTLTVIIVTLILMLAGLAYLTNAYQITATEPGTPQYQSVLSLVLAAVAGRGVFYYVAIASILTVLSLSANTSFADFPRLCRAIASDGYLPRSFSNRGRRLVYSEGIIVLAVLSGVILTIFGGVTDRLIPLFAIGAFLAFTLSQAGMVAHWKKEKSGSKTGHMFLNGLGATATAITICIVLVAKFVDGAWVVALLIPGLVALMAAVHRHYVHVERETAPIEHFRFRNLKQPLVVVPLERWSRTSEHALQFAMSISRDLHAVHIQCGEDTESLCRKWSELVQTPAREAGLPEPQLSVVESPYRFIIQPILDFVLKMEQDNPERTIAVVLPDFVERRWYYYFLHNQRAELLSALLLLNGKRRIVIINVPWYMEER